MKELCRTLSSRSTRRDDRLIASIREGHRADSSEFLILGAHPFDGARKHGQMPPMREGSSSTSTARLGRRVGIIAFAIPVAGITALWSFQILGVVFAAPPEATVACKDGLLGLEQAVRRARQAAAGEPNGERAALDSFRAALRPEWDHRPGLERACDDDPRTRAALREIDALRYAEEHAVRYEAGAVADQRRRTDDLVRELRGPLSH